MNYMSSFSVNYCIILFHYMLISLRELLASEHLTVYTQASMWGSRCETFLIGRKERIQQIQIIVSSGAVLVWGTVIKYLRLLAQNRKVWLELTVFEALVHNHLALSCWDHSLAVYSPGRSEEEDGLSPNIPIQTQASNSLASLSWHIS